MTERERDMQRIEEAFVKAFRDERKRRAVASATKPARSTNGVSFAELMRELRGE